MNDIIYPPSFPHALMSLRPGAQWSLHGNDYEGLIWHEPPVFEGGQTKPSKEEIESEIERLKSQWEYYQYRRDREQEYPDFKQYLDGLVKGDTEQMQAYIDACLAVKAKYPKPEVTE